MNSEELKSINFKPALAICYEEVQPFLERELEVLRSNLIDLPDDASESEKLAHFQSCVEALNQLEEQFDNDESINGGIHTDEREFLCDYLYQMGCIIGLDTSEYVDHWRTW